MPLTAATLADAFAEVEVHNCHVTSVRLSLVDFDRFQAYGFNVLDHTLWGASVVIDEEQPEGTYELRWESGTGGRKTAWERVLIDLE